ncbi:MAG: class I SAM-dependent methyltransferase [Pyrinomonadaceae bacterium]|nr:class I SAM-dependent methyltransferase [Sphingobacteriaceae bacterium]
MNDLKHTSPYVNKAPHKIIDGINIYDRDDYNEWFETAYNDTAEPWDYSKRAGELYRHRYSVKQILKYNSNPEVLLELGSSKGLMTKLLIPHTRTLYAADISLTALSSCKQNCEVIAKESNCRLEYFLTTTPGLPFAPESFDVVTVCDGLEGWWLSEEQKRAALEEIYKVLKKGGIAILTDCLMPELNKTVFEDYKKFVRSSPLSVVNVSYLYDKVWYKLESALKKARLQSVFGGLLASVPLAKLLNSFGKTIGTKAARHIVVILRKD